MKSLFQEVTLLLETFRKNRNEQDYYPNIVEKLQNTQRSSKAYWPSLKIFLNNKKNPCHSTTVSQI